MPYFPKAEAPNVQPYWCPPCAAWYLPQAGPHLSCCVAHAPGSCCHYGETKLIAEGSQPQPAVVTWWPYVPPTITTGSVTVTTHAPYVASNTVNATDVQGSWSYTDTDLMPRSVSGAELAAWGKSMTGGDTSHMVDS